MGVIKEIGQGVIVGAVVGVLGSVIVHVGGLGSPPVWVFMIVGAVAAIAYSLAVRKVKRAGQKGGRPPSLNSGGR